MDRLMVYPGAIPLDTDVLSVERNVMTALGWMTQATFGTNVGVAGLPCTPTVPASMTVNIGPGAIWAQAQIDQNQFGSLPADPSPLMKMGILAEAAGTNFTLTAPVTSGQSINCLIEAAFEETDKNPIVLPYVNPSNPAQPYTGPDNAGTPQNTTRAQVVDLQLKAGVAANAGTQITPSVDEGYVGLYVITVNYGQTSITAADINIFADAPFCGGPFMPASAGPFAPAPGNANQQFYVGTPTQPAQAVQLGQFTIESSGDCNMTTWPCDTSPSGVIQCLTGFVQTGNNGNEWWFTFPIPFKTQMTSAVGSDGGGGCFSFGINQSGSAYGTNVWSKQDGNYSTGSLIYTIWGQ